MSDLSEAEERWRLTIDSAPVGIALVALDGSFLRVNDALCAMLGYAADALVRLSFQALTHPDDLLQDLDLRDQLVAGRIPRYRLRKRYVRADHQLIWADLFVSLARNHDGEPLHFISYIDDVSDQVATASRLDQINRDLTEQSARLARSNDDLESFATLASHDLQAPLSTIRGYLELLDAQYAESLGSPGTDWLARAIDAADRMTELVTSLLEFSRATGSGEPERSRIDVQALLDGVLADLAGVVAATDTVIRLATRVPEVVADPPRLHQVLQNLIQNAIKYHPRHSPRIDVTVSESGPDWLFVVADDGPGVPDEDRERVFGMYRQAHGAAAGYGIGLAVSRRIVERHGGRIWIEDNPDGGSLFCFTVPLPQSPPEPS